jgi:hypothetical protein
MLISVKKLGLNLVKNPLLEAFYHNQDLAVNEEKLMKRIKGIIIFAFLVLLLSNVLASGVHLQTARADIQNLIEVHS